MKELARVQRIQEMYVQVQNDHFAQGYTEGYNHFIAQKQIRMSDEQIACFIEQAMSSPCSRISNAGYVTGWLAALMKQQADQTGQMPRRIPISSDKQMLRLQLISQAGSDTQISVIGEELAPL